MTERKARMSRGKVNVKKGTKANDATTLPRPQKLRARAGTIVARPSTTTHRAWIYAVSPARELAEWEDGSAGKWCVFRHKDVVDDTWAPVHRAVAAGRLPLAKVSTRLTATLRDNTHVICVYTKDWRDDAAITAARDVLRELGFKEELGYKRDIETARGVYGTSDEWYRRG
jgi:hypothetical protein